VVLAIIDALSRIAVNTAFGSRLEYVIPVFQYVIPVFQYVIPVL
jgi:hypothetical protein